MSKTKKNKTSYLQYIGFLIFTIIGVFCGILILEHMESMSEMGKSRGKVLIELSFIFVGLYLAILLQIMIHEAGHLIFGLLTGYRYSSFRIGSYMWMKDNEKWRLRKLSIAGTGGQCLMTPPDMVDGKIPYILYNLGGSILNICFSVIFLGIYLVSGDIPFLSIFLLISAIVGFAFALINGIPMRLGMVDNDGYNALSLGKNSEALRSFWIQLNTNEQLTKGARLKDMPEEWFTVPSAEGMKNSMTAVMGVFFCNKLMDAHEFDQADRLMEEYLLMDTAIVDLHRRLLICDRIYCEIIGDNRKDKLQEMLDQKQIHFMNSMKRFPSVLRTEYVYALLAEQDMVKVAKIKEQFEKCARTHPYTGDVESERELIAIAENMAKG